jgi:fatty-acid desaturase
MCDPPQEDHMRSYALPACSTIVSGTVCWHVLEQKLNDLTYAVLDVLCCAGDLSTNCWWVAAVSFGEGWHNSHHAFPYSARHGLEWWELDPTWYLICALKAVGLVWDVQVHASRHLTTTTSHGAFTRSSVAQLDSTAGQWVLGLLHV